ncbi:homeobox-domain-containing protein [Artomyces pyxidatus]|uniref:Homeobox-domain-containing protein n=1 Tax=Artomyces pyxidatus TaxID=48021 RepID=A0ACB8TDQ8_9AGAM|nr:homeobox-domain-containing protein [Artomyces pyxidatus]
MSPARPDLARTSSLTSVESDGAASDSRRTRKRFTDWQLAMLEQLFHRTSHPTRDEREALARDLRMEQKSVTIWFQNRRQSERKAALHTTPNARKDAHTTPARRTTPRVKLDDLATRSERRTGLPRAPDPSKSLWDNMPSSPLAPPSPPRRELVEFGRGRTLEWACAAARLSGRSGDETEDEDEEEPHEAITPMGSLSGGVFWEKTKSGGAMPVQGKSQRGEKRIEKGKERERVTDDEVMTAALVLCGLGRRS